ncbi:hypothetical protein SPI_01982 [Niveomyces insectorum RCEF 264]|uniref:Uncharacterized protein n=1 Tax=Niveomyces insectorum RCEF 264 TaxID=1081102 RepID=A0A167XNN6_9HYPO|nr:hypothetical protein SPI_01982 [Niveomyces insectorum RCEF 264]
MDSPTPLEGRGDLPAQAAEGPGTSETTPLLRGSGRQAHDGEEGPSQNGRQGQGRLQALQAHWTALGIYRIVIVGLILVVVLLAGMSYGAF